jgi:tripartite-type tricarboxylate transporter receptor subunit TctC
MSIRRKTLMALLATAVLPVLSPSPALAQAFSQPVKIVVGFPAGGSVDVTARLIADKMQASLGMPVIVENKPGAAGRIAVEAVKGAPADGKTLLLTPVAMMSIFPTIYKNMRYDPVKDFEPISQLTVFEYAVAVGNQMPVKTVGELAAWAKANPQKAIYGTPAAGSLPHFFSVMFARSANIDLTHAAYKGSAPAMNELIGGHLPMLFDTAVDLTEMHKAGKIRVLATSGTKRAAILPDVPTFKEAGYKIEATGWAGLYAPAGTPADMVKKLNKAAVAAITQPDVKEKLAARGMAATGTTPAELARIQKADAELWAPAVKASGFNPEN